MFAAVVDMSFLGAHCASVLFVSALVHSVLYPIGVLNGVCVHHGQVWDDCLSINVFKLGIKVEKWGEVQVKNGSLPYFMSMESSFSC